jgi:hypothetical protein
VRRRAIVSCVAPASAEDQRRVREWGFLAQPVPLQQSGERDLRLGCRERVESFEGSVHLAEGDGAAFAGEARDPADVRRVPTQRPSVQVCRTFVDGETRTRTGGDHDFQS